MDMRNMSRWGLQLLALLLLYCGCGESVETIDVAIYNGTGGQVVSYNYPFVYDRAGYHEINYRIFSSLYAKSICLRFHRFDILYENTLTIYTSDNGIGIYYNSGERTYENIRGVFPADVWLGDFCVPLEDGKDYLKVKFTHNGKEVRGFQFDYWALFRPTIAHVSPTPQEKYLRDGFMCYNRKGVPLWKTCDGQPDCDDSTDETFAHAQCKDVNTQRPRQRPGMWACNFDGGVCSSDMSNNYDWKVASCVASDEEGPRTDHTHSRSGQGKFVHTVFGNWGQRANLYFSPSVGPTQDYCLSFWYFMSGNDPGKLSVGWMFGNEHLWQRIGSYGYKWLQGQVYLKVGGYRSQIRFVAERGSQAENRISLDDISVLPGQCPYTDGSFTSPGWNFGDCFTYSSDNSSIKCNNEKDRSVVSSPMIASGKCLVLSVRFPSGSIYMTPRVEVHQLDLGKISPRYIGRITYDNWNTEETKKYTISSTKPFQISLRVYSDRGKGVIIENFYVVDNDCDNLSLGSCDTDEFYCSEGQCIKSSKKCDGIRDCNNGRDENDCTYEIPGVTVATGLIGACIIILLGLTCILYSINKKSTQRAQEARDDRRNTEIANRSRMFVVGDWEQGANPGFPFDDPDSLPPSYNDCVADRVVAPRESADDTADSTSLPPYDDFLTGSYVELNPITLKPMDQPNE